MHQAPLMDPWEELIVVEKHINKHLHLLTTAVL